MKRSLIIVMASLLTIGVYAQNLGVLNVVTEEWADATNADGTGLYFDILRAVYEPVGGRLSIQIMPYTRAVSTVQNKRADIVIGLYEDEADSVIYPAYHLDSDDVSALYLKSRYPTYHGEPTLDGKALVWMRGYAYDEYLSVSVRHTEVDRRDVAITMVTSRRADFFLDARADIEAALSESSANVQDLAIGTVMQLHLYVCFADTAKGRNLAAIWDQRFPALLAAGVIDALFEEWDFGEYEY